uniref:NADH-ubiquinone oxidoreductase chain 3 n=2 Tax=Lumbriculus variegatus TaxID=61662 RepID=A0A7D6W3Z0_9ANNE|nr:NADH dehydrogenase subunit 3 [Lumbriculus variegatus]FAA04222.1 TPA: NADH dehydrogenase subunit 3 [Lumbriculus variegatus]
MNLMLITFFIVFMLVSIVYIMSYILSMHLTSNSDKQSPFECGFDPNHQARIPFSLRFFLLAIIFIVFDIEIALLMPVPLYLVNIQQTYLMLVANLFLFILLMGILYEWHQGSLDWSS